MQTSMVNLYPIILGGAIVVARFFQMYFPFFSMRSRFWNQKKPQNHRVGRKLFHFDEGKPINFHCEHSILLIFFPSKFRMSLTTLAVTFFLAISISETHRPSNREVGRVGWPGYSETGSPCFVGEIYFLSLNRIHAWW